MAGLHVCPFCQYKFETDEALDQHMNQGRGCPEERP